MVDLVKLEELAKRLNELSEYVAQQPPVQYEQAAATAMVEAATALSSARAEIERLREALTLAANRLNRLTLECDVTDGIYYDAQDWTKEARASVNEALEKAAKVADSVNNFDNPMTATDVADAIRAMKGHGT